MGYKSGKAPSQLKPDHKKKEEKKEKKKKKKNWINNQEGNRTTRQKSENKAKQTASNIQHSTWCTSDDAIQPT